MSSSSAALISLSSLCCVGRWCECECRRRGKNGRGGSSAAARPHGTSRKLFCLPLLVRTSHHTRSLNRHTTHVRTGLPSPRRRRRVETQEASLRLVSPCVSSLCTATHDDIDIQPDAAFDKGQTTSTTHAHSIVIPHMYVQAFQARVVVVELRRKKQASALSPRASPRSARQHTTTLTFNRTQHSTRGKQQEVRHVQKRGIALSVKVGGGLVVVVVVVEPYVLHQPDWTRPSLFALLHRPDKCIWIDRRAAHAHTHRHRIHTNSSRSAWPCLCLSPTIPALPEATLPTLDATHIPLSL